MNLRSCSDFPVYHTAFDSYSWMTNYGDPLFQRHVAGELSFSFSFIHKWICTDNLSIKYCLEDNVISVLCYLSCRNLGTSSPSPGWWFNYTIQLPLLCSSVAGTHVIFFWLCLEFFSVCLCLVRGLGNIA